ncbi:hypothetical protein D5S17_24950 [Pseudonocardiaceae bacterium YIM PH 21723]|nr:hypothetical protein D5S17_24950 [Pseudonocardiaceae bacterium YIM PH 21723]
MGGQPGDHREHLGGDPAQPAGPGGQVHDQVPHPVRGRAPGGRQLQLHPDPGGHRSAGHPRRPGRRGEARGVRQVRRDSGLAVDRRRRRAARRWRCARHASGPYRRRVTNGRKNSAPVPALPGPGRLLVLWATLAALGAGLISSGLNAETGVLVRVARLLFDLTGAGAVGIAVTALLIRGHGGRAERDGLAAARRAGVALGGLWSVSTLVLLFLLAADLSPAGLRVPVADFLRYATDTISGRCLLATLAAALLTAALHRFAARVPPQAPLLVAAAGVLPLALSGHATDDHSSLAAWLLTLHVLGAVIWAGGLATTVGLLATRRGLLAHVLPRFSRVAGGSLIAVTAGGLLTAALVLPGPAALATPYGWLLFGKTAALLAAAGLGGHVRGRLLDRVARHQPGTFGRWVAVELTVLAGAIALAATLAATPVQ